MANDLVVPKKKERYLTPAFRVLNERQRKFVENLFDPTCKHNRAECARRAGYGIKRSDGSPSTPEVMTAIASELMQRPDVRAAFEELAKRKFRDLAPKALETIETIIVNPEHKDAYKASIGIFDRVDPPVSKQEIAVTHETVDHASATKSILRKMRERGMTDEQIVASLGGPSGFGDEGVRRYLRMLDAEQRDKPIEGSFKVLSVDDQKPLVNDAHAENISNTAEPEPWMK